MSGGETLHASAVAVEDRGLLILGPSGSGKSSLALGLIARGAVLVADDRTEVHREGSALRLSAPEAIVGLVEARGIGLIRLPHRPAQLAMACRLGGSPPGRLPAPQTLDLHGVAVPLFLSTYRPDLADALIVLLGGGALEDPDGGWEPR